MFENMVLRRIFESKRDGVTGEWRRLRNEKLYDLQCSANFLVIISRRMRWAGHMARLGDMRGVYRILVRRLGGKETASIQSNLSRYR